MGIADKFKARRAAKDAAKASVELDRLIEEASKEANALHEAWQYAMLQEGVDDVPGVMLKAGEVAYLVVDGAAFVEPKRAPGEWQGRSQGTSVRIAKGVSYRVGGSKGTFVQGEERPTPTDQGTFIVTDRRFIFIGSKRTTEWAYSKLMGYDTEGPGTAFFNVSNRQKTTGVMFGTEAEGKVDAVIVAAIARFTGPEQHARLVAEMEAEYRYTYALWESLVSGAEPPHRSHFEVQAPEVDSAAMPSATISPEAPAALPTRDDVAAILRAGDFHEADDDEGFGVRDEGDRLKVFWVKSDSWGRDELVPAMAKCLRDAGRKARVAREDGYPYVSVTG